MSVHKDTAVGRVHAQHKFQIQTDCSDCELLTGKCVWTIQDYRDDSSMK